MSTETLIALLAVASVLGLVIGWIDWRIRELRGLFEAHLELHERHERLYLDELAARASRRAGE